MIRLILVFSILLFNSSCKNKIEKNNEMFLEKYGKEVEEINRKRKESAISQPRTTRFNEISFNNNSQTPILLRNDGMPRSTGTEIFDAKYSEINYPSQYNRGRTSFDDIKIPAHDYFGIKSNLEDKEYDLVDKAVLQENIDYVDNYFDSINREVNLILLKEKEEIRKKKMEELFLISTNSKTTKPISIKDEMLKN